MVVAGEDEDEEEEDEEEEEGGWMKGCMLPALNPNFPCLSWGVISTHAACCSLVHQLLMCAHTHTERERETDPGSDSCPTANNTERGRKGGGGEEVEVGEM